MQSSANCHAVWGFGWGCWCVSFRERGAEYSNTTMGWSLFDDLFDVAAKARE